MIVMVKVNVGRYTIPMGHASLLRVGLFWSFCCEGLASHGLWVKDIRDDLSKKKNSSNLDMPICHGAKKKVGIPKIVKK